MILISDEMGAFVYAQENHTSVLGMREVVADKCSTIISLPSEELSKIFSSNLKSDNHHANYQDTLANSLFVFSAQCNFSGVKHPLSWVGMSQAGILKSGKLKKIINNDLSTTCR